MSRPWKLWSKPLLDARLEPLAFKVTVYLWAASGTQDATSINGRQIAAAIDAGRNATYAALQYLLQRRLFTVEARLGIPHYVCQPPEKWDAAVTVPTIRDSDRPYHTGQPPIKRRSNASKEKSRAIHDTTSSAGSTGAGSGLAGQPAPRVEDQRETTANDLVPGLSEADGFAAFKAFAATLKQEAAAGAAPADLAATFDAPPTQPLPTPRRWLPALVPPEDA